MVAGIEKFREYFAGHEDQYVLIGGAACHLLFDEADLQFRVSKDIDMVLCVEVVDAAFGSAFRAFLDEGGYQARERSSGHKEFYRFHRPTDPRFPFMLELFSRGAEVINMSKSAELTPVPVEGDVISLSAILLNEDYYEAIQVAKKQVDGVTIIDETLLIPFKARAFLDLTARREAGEKVSGSDIKKHRNDVFRLVELLLESTSVEVSDLLREDIKRFVELVKDDDTLDPQAFGVTIDRDEAISIIRNTYGLT
ncbi:MAG: hypothetical protein ACR2PR_00610 [Pseudohongiellaceae bacterium]